jgi:Zn-dependent protease with chaperone function
MTTIDFDFGRYIAMRKGEVQQRARDGAAYSYAGERKVRRALASARPVLLAIESTSRSWKKKGRDELVRSSDLATDERHNPVFGACADAARVLALEPPPVYVTSGDFPVCARALGAEGDAYLVVSKRLVDVLEPPELVAVLGHELGHIQNNHIPYATALFYLRHSAGMFVRWTVQPAIMTLQAWHRRAEITCDRAALIVTRDLSATLRGLIKADLAVDGKDLAQVDDYLEEGAQTDERGLTRYADLFRSRPYLPKRIEALRIFAEGRFYKRFCGDKEAAGMSAEEVDERVTQL